MSFVDIVEVNRVLRTTETRLNELQSAKEPAAKENTSTLLAALMPQLRAAILKTGPDDESLRLMGTVESDIETAQPAGMKSFKELQDHMRATLADLTAWLGIVWRAEIGLFYLSCVLSNGVFRVEEVSMFWAEITIAPVVIPAVFFLSQVVGLADPTKGTSTARFGVAFLLGFSIRRTVGLLDLAKKILPDPDTSPIPTKATAGASQKLTTVTTVTASTAQPPAAKPATFTVAVKATTTNAGIPTGTVTLKDGSKVLPGELSLSPTGTVSHTPQLEAGSHKITAEYAGDTIFTGSTGELDHVVT